MRKFLAGYLDIWSVKGNLHSHENMSAAAFTWEKVMEFGSHDKNEKMLIQISGVREEFSHSFSDFSFR